MLSFPVEDNLVLTQYDEPPFARGILRNDAAIAGVGEASHRGVRHPDAVADVTARHAVRRQPAEGGRRPRVQPRARGCWCSTSRPAASTSAASSSSTARSIAKRDAGAAVLLVSAELDEVLELSDRIAVMYRGELVALVDGPTAEREEIGLLMADRPAAMPRRAEAAADRRRGGDRLRPSARPGRWPRSRRLRSSWRCSLGSLLIIAVEPGDRAVVDLAAAARRVRSLLEGATGLSFIDVTRRCDPSRSSIDPEQAAGR